MPIREPITYAQLVVIVRTVRDQREKKVSTRPKLVESFQVWSPITCIATAARTQP